MISTFQIRSAVPAEAHNVAKVHVHSWQAAYRGLLPSDYLASLRPEDRAARYDFTHTDPARPHTRIAVAGETILGFATFMPSADLPGYGELCALYVDPSLWGQGLGVALITDARARMAEQGFHHALLWLLKGNKRGDRFYRIDGWSPDGACKREVMWGIEIEDLRYLRPLP